MATSTIKRQSAAIFCVKIDATVLAGSYFDVPNLVGCTSNSYVFFQQLSEGVVGEGLYFYYLQPAAGHCLVYVRNLDGSQVSTGTRILGNLLYKLQ